MSTFLSCLIISSYCFMGYASDTVFKPKRIERPTGWRVPLSLCIASVGCVLLPSITENGLLLRSCECCMISSVVYCLYKEVQEELVYLCYPRSLDELSSQQPQSVNLGKPLTELLKEKLIQAD